MSSDKSYLENAYRVENTDETREFYGEWAASYDAELAENGYATPRRCAEALAQFMADKAQPVLDIGCGTGLSGVALKSIGISVIDGTDLSPEMLQQAATRRGLYRSLIAVEADNPLPFDQGSYAAVSAMGVLAIGHAPAETIDAILALLAPGGLFVFSLNDHTLEDPSYEARVAENLDCGNARLLFKEHGPHLPGIGMESNVYVMQKM